MTRDSKYDFYTYLYYEEGCCTPLYAGKGRGQRAWQHLTECQNPKTRWHKKLKSLLDAGFQVDIEIQLENLSEAEAHLAEIHLIRHFGRIDLGTGCLYNCTDGGEGVTGLVVSDETRRKMSEAATGRKMPKEAVEKTRQFWLNHRHSDETKLLLSQINTGKQASEETKIKMRESQAARSGRPIVALQNGRVVKRFPSIREAVRAGFSNVKNCLQTPNRSCGGYQWDYQ